MCDDDGHYDRNHYLFRLARWRRELSSDVKRH